MRCERCGVEGCGNSETGSVEEHRVFSCFNGWIKMVLCERCYMMWGE